MNLSGDNERHEMKCLICRLPYDMDHWLFGRLIYRHVNRYARKLGAKEWARGQR